MRWQDYVGLFGCAVCLATTLALTQSFYSAYFLDGVTKFMVDFNFYNEAMLEMVMLPTGIVSFIWYWVWGRWYE